MAMGFVTNLARPGGNITGISNMASDLGGKLVELLVEIAPGMKHVGVVRNPNNPAVTLLLRETEKAIGALGLRLEVMEASAAEEFESAFARLSTLGVKGVVLLADPSIIEHENRIAEVALKTRLPTAFQRRENVEAGSLLSYGPHLTGQFRQAAGLCRPHSEGRQACRSAGATPDQVRAGHQSHDREGAWADHPRIVPCCAPTT